MYGDGTAEEGGEDASHHGRRFVALERRDRAADSTVLWDHYNVRHLCIDHPERRIGRSDIERVLCDPKRSDFEDVVRGNKVSVTRLPDGRWVLVGWHDWYGQRYPFHAREVSERFVRRLER